MLSHKNKKHRALPKGKGAPLHAESLKNGKPLLKERGALLHAESKYKKASLAKRKGRRRYALSLKTKNGKPRRKRRAGVAASSKVKIQNKSRQRITSHHDSIIQHKQHQATITTIETLDGVPAKLHNYNKHSGNCTQKRSVKPTLGDGTPRHQEHPLESTPHTPPLLPSS